MTKLVTPALALTLLALSGCGSEGGGENQAAAPKAVSEEGSADLAANIWRPGAGAQNASLSFKPLGDFIEGDSVSLSNGTEVSLGDWPSVSISSTGDGSCTSTLIGPRTILTAAHCVDAGKDPGQPGQELAGTIGIAGDDFAITCVMHDKYKALPRNSQGGVRGTRDFALCELDRAVDVNRVKPESIDTANPAAGGARVLLTGYGCTNIVITPQGRLTYTRGDGNLRMGDESIDSINIRTPSEPAGIWTATKAQGNEPTLCPGDSGGPVITGATLQRQRVSRRVVAVNSAVGWERNGASYQLLSYVAPLATADFRTFIARYVADRPTTKICGYNQNPGFGGCRA